eukprot:2845910-Prymnesium_polylepis.2
MAPARREGAAEAAKPAEEKVSPRRERPQGCTYYIVLDALSHRVGRVAQKNPYTPTTLYRRSPDRFRLPRPTCSATGRPAAPRPRDVLAPNQRVTCDMPVTATRQEISLSRSLLAQHGHMGTTPDESHGLMGTSRGSSHTQGASFCRDSRWPRAVPPLGADRNL